MGASGGSKLLDLNLKSQARQDEPSNWALIRRLLALGWYYRWGCVQVLVLQAGAQLMNLAALGLLGLGVDVIRHHAGHGAAPPHYWFGVQPPDDWSARAQVAAVAGALTAVALLYALLWYGAMISEAKLVQNIIVRLRTDVYDKLQRLSFRFFDTNESGSIINRVTADVQAVRLFVDSVIIEGLVLVLAIASYMAYMLAIHVGLTLACMVTMPVIWVGVVMFSRIVRPMYREIRGLVDDMILRLSENIQGMHVVKGFARQSMEIDKFRQASGAVRDQQRWIFWRVTTFMPAITYLTYLSQAILLGYGGYLVMHDRLPLGSGLIVFAGILQQLATRVSEVTNIANSVQRSLTGAARVFEVLDAPVEIASPAGVKGLPVRLPGVKFEDVTFGYKDDQPVLHAVSFEVPPGGCTALVGVTGSGKSTLLSLVPRFYDAAAGRVLVGGVDVRELDLDDLRRGIGVVFQENFLFSNTVAANIAFGHPEAGREQIEKAARTAAIHEFITTLPKGYDTVIGENGVDLSGGQRQRLALARALLLDPPILLLDDPTAGVDPQTEQEILEAMDRAVVGRTTLIVTHRFSTLRWADRVVVMDAGRVVQVGSHEQLMNSDGWYRDTATLQMTDGHSPAPVGVQEGQP